MTPLPSRRAFLRAALPAVGAAALAPSWIRAAARQPTAESRRFSFLLLGDLHFDRWEHHDFDWLARTHPNDLSQIKNYTQLTRDVMPALFTTLGATIADLNREPATRVAMTVQVGDFVEGLCGSEALAERQDREAIEFVRGARLGAPFLFCKGNHDVTGDGAREAFARVFLPFLEEQARLVSAAAAPMRDANFSIAHANAQFVFFDAYQNTSLEWLEAVVERRTAEHLFVILHPPVVPYGARSTWHLYASVKDQAKRTRLLALLARQRALVLGGHIHRYCALGRSAPGGRFAQFALSSVISDARPSPKTVLSGLAAYTPDQIAVEPKFSPDTAAARRAVYEAERPFVRAFDYADLPGYAVVTVDGPRVSLRMYAGTTRTVWRTVDLTALAEGASLRAASNAHATG